MPKFKKVGRSKLPLAHQLPIMAENLRYKYNISASIDITTWCMDHKEGPHTVYTIYLENRDHMKYKTWESLLDQYFYLLNKV